MRLGGTEALADLPGVAAVDAPQLNASEISAGEDEAAAVQPPQPPPADASQRKRAGGGSEWVPHR
jgi:hypothetical protein